MFLFYDNETGVVTSYDTHSDALDAVEFRVGLGGCVIIDTVRGLFWSYDEDSELIEAGRIENKN